MRLECAGCGFSCVLGVLKLLLYILWKDKESSTHVRVYCKNTFTIVSRCTKVYIYVCLMGHTTSAQVQDERLLTSLSQRELSLSLFLSSLFNTYDIYIVQYLNGMF